MPQKRPGQYIQELSLAQKLVMVGGILAAISVFMPWYSDLDRFNSGAQFYGITGPLYLVGLFFLATGCLIVSTFFAGNMKRRIQDSGLKIRNFYMIAAGFLAFLLVLTASVYFHENFGTNISEKDFRFGMTIAVLGILSLFAGSVLLGRERPKLTGDDLFGGTLEEPLTEFAPRAHQTLTDMPESEKESIPQGKIDL